MPYVTQEIKYNNKLREVLDKNIKLKPYDINKKLLYFSNPKRAMFIGNVYELMLQVEIMKAKKIKYPNLRELKYSRGLSLVEECIRLYSGQDRVRPLYIINIAQKHEFIIYKYLHGSKLKTKDLFKALFYLTFISEFRTREDVSINKFQVSKDDYRDILALKESLSDKIIGKFDSKQVRFNLGIRAGELTGEIDILKKNKIVDIKTTREGIFSTDMIYQLILYYFMCKANKIEIDVLSIYFARFGVEEKIKVKDLFEKSGEKKIEKFLKKVYLY